MPSSVSTITNKSYTIPQTVDDSDEIQRFLECNRGKPVIVVQGLGFVGAVMALVCANTEDSRYAVIGIDLPNEASYWKVKSLNEGVFPLVAEDPKIEQFFVEARNQNSFLATCDPSAFDYADIVIVDVNLDVQKESSVDGSLIGFEVDLSKFKSAIQTIGAHCQENVFVLVETTVPPGTCERVVKPILDEALQTRGLSSQKYKLGHSYERVMPGPNYVDSIRKYPRVYAGVDKISGIFVENFLRTIIDTTSCTLTRLENTTASEMSKVLENSYRAMNISFAVEWSRFAEEAGVDLYAMVNAIRERATHSNLMYPGLGVGGYCLTKDPLLASWGRKEFFDSENDLPLSVKSVSINDQMPSFAFRRLQTVFGDLAEKKVLLFGVSYRGDVGDTRFTPVQRLVSNLMEACQSISFHDPYVSFWPELGISVETDVSKALESSPDLVVFSTGHSVYREQGTIDKLMNLPACMIFDTIGIFGESQLATLLEKHQVSVLGRGDINLKSG